MSEAANIAKYTIKDLLEAGVHYGHKTMRWNPKMAPYIYGVKNGIHILDLQKTAYLLKKALEVIYEVSKNNGRILFVGTKTQAQEVIAEMAKKCGQYYVNFRWLGGMLTNWPTVSRSIKTLRDLEAEIAKQEALVAGEEADRARLTKKEKLDLTRKAEKLNKALGGICEMGGRPDLLVVIDVNKDNIAIKEANKLGIPVIGILDSNSNPDGIMYPVPGNDDAIRSISLLSDLIANTVLNGMQDSLVASGVDLGAAENITNLRHTKSRSPAKVEAEAKSSEVKTEKVEKAKEPTKTKEKPKTTTLVDSTVSASVETEVKAVKAEKKPKAEAATKKTKKEA